MDKGEMSLKEALFEIRSFEAACFEFSNRAGLAGRPCFKLDRSMRAQFIAQPRPTPCGPVSHGKSRAVLRL
jgi:hypothetical protein